MACRIFILLSANKLCSTLGMNTTPSPLDRIKNLKPVDPAVMQRFEALAKARRGTDRQRQLEQAQRAQELRHIVLF